MATLNYAGQNQVVAINRGTQHGMAPGHVLAVLKTASACRTARTNAEPP